MFEKGVSLWALTPGGQAMGSRVIKLDISWALRGLTHQVWGWLRPVPWKSVWEVKKGEGSGGVSRRCFLKGRASMGGEAGHGGHCTQWPLFLQRKTGDLHEEEGE